MDAWPLNDIYGNLMEIAAYNGIQYGGPQDAESRPFFFWKEYLKGIGYSDSDIDALPSKVASGDYTLANVLEDAKKAVSMGLVEEGYGFYPRVSNGPDYAQFYQSFGGELMDSASGKLLLDKASMQEFYQFFADAVAAGVTIISVLIGDNGTMKSQMVKLLFGMVEHGTMLDTLEKKEMMISSEQFNSLLFQQEMTEAEQIPLRIL